MRGGPLLDAANFRNGTVDILKGDAGAPNLVGNFTDPNLPAGDGLGRRPRGRSPAVGVAPATGLASGAAAERFTTSAAAQELTHP